MGDLAAAYDDALNTAVTVVDNPDRKDCEEFDVLVHWVGCGPCRGARLRAPNALTACWEGVEIVMKTLKERGLLDDAASAKIDLMSVLVVKLNDNSEFYARHNASSEPSEDKALEEFNQVMSGGGKRGWPSF